MSERPVNRAARQALAMGAAMVLVLGVVIFALQLGHSPPP